MLGEHQASYKSRVLLGVLMIVASMIACVDPLTTHASPSPVWEAKNAKAYGETVAGLPPDKAYGWDLSVAGGTARWRECKGPNECSEIERERPAGDLLSFKPVGRIAGVDGGDVEVLELSLAPHPTYVVPSKAPAAR
jgi:hypothetical protein